MEIRTDAFVVEMSIARFEDEHENDGVCAQTGGERKSSGL
jgi:hypothetical protein